MIKIYAFRDLIRAFVEERITVEEFERIYLSLFKNPINKFPDQIFRILSSLYCDVDAYSPLFTADEDDGLTSITEPTLHQKAKEALKLLEMHIEE